MFIHLCLQNLVQGCSQRCCCMDDQMCPLCYLLAGLFTRRPLTAAPTATPHLIRPNLSLSLCPPCHPQISTRHKFRLFHVLGAVIGATESLEETWEKSFMQLALENMTRSTVSLPHHPPPPNRPFHKGF